MIEGLPDRALGHLAVTAEAPDPRRRAVEPLAGERQARGHRQALAERARGDVDPGQHRRGVALEPAAELAEAEQLVVVDRPGRLEARIEERRGVALGEDQVVVRGVARVLEVEPEVAVEQHGHQLGCGHRRGRVARAAGIAAANRVHPQLLCQLAAEVVSVHVWVIPTSVAPSLPGVAWSTRRQFLGAAGAAVGGLALLDDGELAQRERPPDAPNVLLIVIDTLRTDHVYGKKARTPNMDALIRQGLSFSRCYPEAMPTVPARRSIMTGRRVFPFRDWHPWPQLPQEPGWAPIAEPALTFTSVLRRAGWWTACVTDNTFLGFAPCFTRYRAQLQPLRAPRGTGRRSARRRVRGRVAALASARDRQPRDTRPHPPLPRERRLLPRRDALVLGAGVPLGDRPPGRRRAAAPVRARGGRLRAPRAVDAAAPLHRHVRRPGLPRTRARAALVQAGGGLSARAPRGGATGADEGALRGRGHSDRPLAGRVPGTPARPPVGARHDRGLRL